MTPPVASPESIDRERVDVVIPAPAAPPAAFAARGGMRPRSPAQAAFAESPSPAGTTCRLSVIAPMKDERDNVEPLYRQLTDVLGPAGIDYELIFVDDGSGDDTVTRLEAAAASDPHVTIITLRRNFGQTAAMSAGIEHSRGEVIVFIDADLQNDPADIPRLLDKLDEPPGWDIVSGWRRRRQDRWLDRRLPSQIANWVIRKTTGVPIRDFGCTLKAYRREVLEGVTLYSEMHRLIPALASWNGARIAELEVNHRPRIHGRTKYNLTRITRVMLDLVTVKFMSSYVTRPIYFFGRFAIYAGIAALMTLAVAIGQRYGHFGQPHGLHLNRNVLVALSALLAFFSVQCVLFGVVSELLVRVYHDLQHRPTYRIRRILRRGGEGG